MFTMPLNQSQVDTLKLAALNYIFPAAYFDFSKNKPVDGLTMRQVEEGIRNDLLSDDLLKVKDGLSNVLYWGFSQMGGLGPVRTEIFRTQVTEKNLLAASRLFSESPRPDLKAIARIGLPQLSMVSFVSKVRMFLDPNKSAVLDKQIMKIHEKRATTVLAAVKINGTAIPVTSNNSRVYEAWCDRLEIINQAYELQLRVVDVERAFFHLVQSGRTQIAADILCNA